VPGDVQAKVLEWVSGGGVLIASGPFGLYDPFGAPTAQVLNACLADTDWHYDAAGEAWTRGGQTENPLPPISLPPGGAVFLQLDRRTVSR